MKIIEGYNDAVIKYGKQTAETLKQNGIPKNFIDAACRFFKQEGVPIEQLQNDWRMWNRYVLNNPLYKDEKGVNKNLATMSYKDFKAEIQKSQQPYVCPNSIYDDGNLCIGECKTQRDARWFPIQNLAYPDTNNDFCVCRRDGGYEQFQKYINDGMRIFIIYDKSRSASDPYKRVLMMSKNGYLYFWNNNDLPCGTTKDKEDPIWEYINSLPREAQLRLSDISEGITELKINKHMEKKRINEYQLRKIVAESVKKVLRESVFDANIQKDIQSLRQIYERWQYAPNKPEGIDKCIDLVIDAMHEFESLIQQQEDLGPYEGEPYNFGY